MLDVDTFLTAVYVLVDEYAKAHHAEPLPDAGTGVGSAGRPASWCASEVVTLAIFAQWGQFGSERACYRSATRHLRAAFPQLPERSQYHRLVRDETVRRLLVAVGHELAEQMVGTACAYEVLDSTALVTRNAKRRGDGWLVGQADLGWSTRVGW